MIGIRELMAAGALAGAVVLAVAPAVPDQPPVGTADQRPAAEIIGDAAQLLVGGISATGVD